MARPTRPTVLVTGAAGKIGAAVVAELRGRDWPVRAVVRRQDARSARLAALGAEVAVADLFDPDQLLAAMRGTARAYYVAPFHPHAALGALAFADAAREAARTSGLEAVVGLSQWLASPAHPSVLTRHHWLADRLFAALADGPTRVAHTVVNPGFFADNYLRLIGFPAQLGVLPSLTGDSQNAPPSNEDIARVSAAALTDPAAHAGRAYRPTGPALLSTADMAAVLGRVLGRAVRRVEMPRGLFFRAARLQGVGAFELSGFRHYVEDHTQGAFALGGPTDDVRAVTGRPAEDFETVARRYAAWPAARRTLGRGVRAWADFLRTPLAPGYDLDALERRLGIPAPPAPRYAMQDPEWRAARAAQVGSIPASTPAASTPAASAQAGAAADRSPDHGRGATPTAALSWSGE